MPCHTSQHGTSQALIIQDSGPRHTDLGPTSAQHHTRLRATSSKAVLALLTFALLSSQALLSFRLDLKVRYRTKHPLSIAAHDTFPPRAFSFIYHRTYHSDRKTLEIQTRRWKRVM
jgi:hypothetical protein